MLTLLKNELVTRTASKHGELRSLELEWLTSNLWTLGGQAAMLAGFSYTQLTSWASLRSDGKSGNLELQSLLCSYLILSVASLAMHLWVVTAATFSCIWGPGLALRGPHGVASVHQAAQELKFEQQRLFMVFVGGLAAFVGSNTLLLWIAYPPWLARTAAGLLTAFGLAMGVALIAAAADLQ